MMSFLDDKNKISSTSLNHAFVSIVVQGLHKSYDDFKVINNLNFEVKAGSSLSIIGPSGCGKSTLLYLLAGLDSADKGEVLFKSTPNKDEKKSFFSLYGRNPRISYVMQDYGLFPWKNAEENLALPLILNKYPKQDINERIESMLLELGLEGVNKKYPDELSGGQRQRLALGRALISSPEILLLDEPFSSVDAITRQHLQKLVYQLWEKYNFTFVLVTHSVGEAIFLGKNVMVLEKIRNNKLNSPLIIENICCGMQGMQDNANYAHIHKQLSHALADVR